MENKYLPVFYINFLTGEMKLPKAWKALLNNHNIQPYAGIGRPVFDDNLMYIVVNKECLAGLEARIAAQGKGSSFIQCEFPLRHSKLIPVENLGPASLRDVLVQNDNVCATSRLIRFRSSWVSHCLTVLTRQNNGEPITEEEYLEPESPIAPPESNEEIQFVLQCLESNSVELTRLASLFVARAGTEIIEHINKKRDFYAQQIDMLTEKVEALNRSAEQIKALRPKD